MLVEKLIQVIDSIPWVRCASGNVLVFVGSFWALSSSLFSTFFNFTIFFNFFLTFLNFFSTFFQFFSFNFLCKKIQFFSTFLNFFSTFLNFFSTFSQLVLNFFSTLMSTFSFSIFICISSNFGHQVASLVLVPCMATK